MTTNRFMTTVVCDDVRKEVGNKLSYMGIYSEKIVVPRFPFTMAKLCFVMSVICPGEEDPPETLTLRMLRNDDVLAELTLPPEGLAAARAQIQLESDRQTRRFTSGSVLQIFPLQFTEPCTLKARALCDGKELKGGSWTVELAP